MKRPELTKDRLKDLLHYDELTGIFTFKGRNENNTKSVKGINPWNAKFKGKETGYLHKLGYVTISIDNKAYRSHRLAFLYMTGEFPKKRC